MIFRLAKNSDLYEIKDMFRRITENMVRNNIDIWDEIYPCEFFCDDIKNNTLYILTDNDVILGAFALYGSTDGQESIEWQCPNKKALYIERFGVNTEFWRKGIGGILIQKAIEIARIKNAVFLRLLVVDINKPAIMMYQKYGFKKLEGEYNQKIEDKPLCEYGFELKI